MGERPPVIRRQVGRLGVIEAIEIAGDRWLRWAMPENSAQTPEFMLVSEQATKGRPAVRFMVMRETELPSIVKDMFGEAGDRELERRYSVRIISEAYAS